MPNLGKITLTDYQQNYVKENYMSMSNYQMAKVLNMSHVKIDLNMKRMGLKSPFSNRVKTLKLAGDTGDIENEFWNDQLHEKYFNY